MVWICVYSVFMSSHIAWFVDNHQLYSTSVVVVIIVDYWSAQLQLDNIIADFRTRSTTRKNRTQRHKAEQRKAEQGKKKTKKKKKKKKKKQKKKEKKKKKTRKKRRRKRRKRRKRQRKKGEEPARPLDRPPHTAQQNATQCITTRIRTHIHKTCSAVFTEQAKYK